MKLLPCRHCTVGQQGAPVAADRHHIFLQIPKMTAEIAELSRAEPVYPDIERLRLQTRGTQANVE